MTVLANDGIGQGVRDALEALGFAVDTTKYEGEALLGRLPEVDALILRSATRMGREQIEAGAAGKLRLIVRAGVGMDNVDLAAAADAGITAVNTPLASSNAVAELALAHLLALSRHLHRSNVSMRSRQWKKKEYQGSEISGRTLGIVGMGRIGTLLARKASALGMRVIYTNRRGPLGDVDFAAYRTLEELLRESDYISVHTPKAGEKPLIGKEEIARMKDGAYLINLARGGIIDEAALLDALDEGKLAGAALDVFSNEPVEDERLLANERISLTPHIGAATSEAQARIGEQLVEIVREFFHV